MIVLFIVCYVELVKAKKYQVLEYNESVPLKQ